MRAAADGVIGVDFAFDMFISPCVFEHKQVNKNAVGIHPGKWRVFFISCLTHAKKTLISNLAL